MARTSARSGAPTGALAVVMAVGVAGLVAQRIAGTSAANAFLYPGTIGVLSLLVAYIATNLGALRHRVNPVFPVLAIAFLLFTIYKNVTGTSFPYDRFPWIVLAWLAVGGAIVALAPGVARGVGEAFRREVRQS